jgi:hypothetical protein
MDGGTSRRTIPRTGTAATATTMGSPVTPKDNAKPRSRSSPVRALIVACAVVAGGILYAAPAQADGGWEAVASSPSHEQIDFAWGIDQSAAESRAMSQCAVLERATDCLLLASGPDCVAVAWDGDEPINHAHAASGGGREVVLQAATAAAGSYANDPAARCSWDPHV